MGRKKGPYRLRVMGQFSSEQLEFMHKEAARLAKIQDHCASCSQVLRIALECYREHLSSQDKTKKKGEKE